MLMYTVRRLVAAVLILFAATFLVYVLVTYAGDPLQEFRENPSPTAQSQMLAREKALHLDVPLIPRYFMWLGGALGCLNPLGTTCDLGTTFQGQAVTDALKGAIAQTLTLITAATILAIIIGVALGVVAALRQYSTLDYGITFLAFVCYSLPSFWIAVLLKQYGAIGFNNFLRNPTIGVASAAAVGLVAGIIWFLASYGRMRTRILLGIFGFALTFGILIFLSVTRWFARPSLGLPLIAILGVLTAVAFTFLLAGLRNRTALYAGLASVIVGLALYFPIQPLLNRATWLMMLLLGILTLLIGAGIGWVVGRPVRQGGHVDRLHRRGPGRAGPVHAVLARVHARRPDLRTAHRHRQLRDSRHVRGLLDHRDRQLHPPHLADHRPDPAGPGLLLPVLPSLDAGDHVPGLHPHRPG